MTIQQQIKSAERELAMRESVYPNLIRRGKMRPDIAEHEIGCMTAIVETLKRVANAESNQKELL